MPCARTPAPAGSIPSRPRSNTGPSFPGVILAPGSGPFSLGAGCAGPVPLSRRSVVPTARELRMVGCADRAPGRTALDRHPERNASTRRPESRLRYPDAF
jgi:hypothetical protein